MQNDAKNGMSLYVKETGTTSAPTIVLLHGGVSSWMWQPQIDQLSEYHLLVPDLPEHGQIVAEKPVSSRVVAT